MRCLIVYNPVSGGSRKFINKLPSVIEKLKKKYDVIDIRATNYAKEAIEIGKEACFKYDVLLVSGGDGTFSEVLQGIGGCSNPPILGYIPSGSCGDIANNHHIPHNIDKAIDLILKGNVKNIDLCKINDSYMSYIAGIGTYTAGVYNADQKLKRKIGKAAYVVSAIKETFNVKSYDLNIKVDNKSYKEKDCILALVMNSKSVGGFAKFNKNAKLDDGKIDLVVVKKDYFNTPVNIWSVFVAGVENLKKFSSVKVYSGKNICVDVKDKVLWNVDGDKSDYQNIEVNCLEKKIRMFVGE